MKKTFLLLGGVVCLLSACSKGPDESAPIPTPEEVKPIIEQTFSGAPPEVKTQVDNVVGYIQSNDPAGAYLHLQQLNARPDLTREQRQVAAEATISVNAKLQEQAEKGDAQAKSILERHRATK